jgi:hypothetical protein
MNNLLKKYLNKFENNELSLDEIEALRFAEEGSVEKKVFWELKEIARQKKDEDDFIEQKKISQKKLLKEES